jgi:O-antigen ligase
MAPPSFLIVIAIYAVVALGVVFTTRRGGLLLGVLVASYCGVIGVSFTRGASGGIWLVQLLLLAAVPIMLSRRALPAYGSDRVTTLTYLLFIMYIVGVAVGMARFDPTLESQKAGTFQSVGGIPLSALMAAYRLFVITGLALAFILPLRFHIDRELFRRFLLLAWVMSVIFGACGIIKYLGVAQLGFTVRTEMGSEHTDLLGFNRASHGLILVVGIFMSYAMTQLNRNPIIKTLAYASAPLLMVSLLFSWSRAATLAMAVSSVSLIVTLGGARAVKGTILTIFGIIVIALVLRNYSDVAERMEFFRTGHVDESGQARVNTWLSLLQYMLEQPDVLLFGVGFQNFHYFLHLSRATVSLEAAHNNFLNVLAEQGIFGFILFIAWLVAIFAWLLRWRRQTPDPTVKVMTGIMTSVMIAAVVSSLTQETLSPAFAQVPWMMHLLLVMGAWVSWYRAEMWTLEQRRRAVTPPQGAAAIPVLLGQRGVGDAVIYG